MAEYKKQHIIPKAYLKSFSDEGGNVCRIDDTSILTVPFNGQNQKDNYYTNYNRKDFEVFLAEIEQMYFRLLESIDYSKKDEGFQTSLQKSSLINNMLHFYSRINPSEENNLNLQGGGINKFSQKESIKIANIITRQLAAKRLFLFPKTRNFELNFKRDWIEEDLYYSTLKLTVGLCKTNSRTLITSDNPMVIFYDDTKESVFGYLPINPYQGLLIYDRQKYSHIETLTRHGVETLNNLQHLNANKCIYVTPREWRSHKDLFLISRKMVGDRIHDVKDKMLNAEIAVTKNLSFIFNENQKGLFVPSYEEALQALQDKIEIDFITKRMTCKADMNLDEMHCYFRLAEIKEHLSQAR
jgi:hypothetical protein